MEPAIANYEFDAGGWRWVYQLWPDKLVAIGIAGQESQHFEFELRHAHDVPNRGVSNLGPRYPMALLIAMAAIMPLTVGLFLAWFLFRPIPVDQPPWPENSDLAYLCIATLVLELSAAILAPYVWPWQSLQRYVAFKRVSDGGELLRLYSVVNPADDAFERFVEEVIAAIRFQKLADTPADYTFKA